MDESAATAFAEALTSLGDEITGEITGTPCFTWMVSLMVLGFVMLAIIVMVSSGDPAPNVTNIYVPAP